MDALEQARRYVAAIPGAVSGSGGHNKTFEVACVLCHGFALSESDAWAVLCDYNRTCSPPWGERELKHKMESALGTTKHAKTRGHLLSKSVSYKFGAGGKADGVLNQRPQSSATGRFLSGGIAPAPSKSKSYDLAGKVELPKPMQDGTQALLKAAFMPGEGVCICPAIENDEGREIPNPSQSALVLSLEEWLAKLGERGGDPNKIFTKRKEKGAGLNGIFIRINPMRQGKRDEDVTAFRHALIEFDNISAGEQWNLIQQSRIPCTAVISSGGKSLHAWVRVDAKDRREYDERVATLYAHFAEHQRPDPKNKNPSRFSRLANCARGVQRQELLSLTCGAESFSAWAAELETDCIGHVVSIDDLLAFRPEADDTTLLGQRWLCRGGSCLMVGQSGIGKSSLSTQAQICWAVGRSFFGIASERMLRSLVIQAENDDGDLAEMVQGVVRGLELTTDEIARLKQNLVFIRDTTHTGEAFAESSRRLIDRHRPDLVWFDPLLSFIGDDVSKQSVCSHFLRTLLGPIAAATGVAWMMVHHTGKPPADPKASKNKTITDFSYMGTGSSELTNWARAVCVLQRVNGDAFELKLAKRGKRAGAKLLDGSCTTSVWLKHAEQGIWWEQIDEPVKESKHSTNRSTAPGGRPKAEFDDVAFMASIGGAVMKYGAMIDRIEEFANVSNGKAKQIWREQLSANFTKDNDDFLRAR
jgi:RecA-family ATPase